MEFMTENKSLLEKIRYESTGPAVKEYLEFVRTELKRAYGSGIDGIELARIHSDYIDFLLEALVSKIIKNENDLDKLPFAVVGVGGYGRRELNPASDVDIIFLVDSEKENLNELILKTAYPLWDSGMDISYSVRNIQDCIKLALENDTVLTSLLDARLIVGSKEEFAKFEKALRDNFILSYTTIFDRIVKMIEQRRVKNQHPGRFIEPNVKEAEGGLRDYHTIRWLLFLKTGAHSIENLVRFRIISRNNLKKFMSAVNFLFIIRNELHFFHQRKHDDIDFESQKRIAGRMGYRDRKNELGVERFMRDFYINLQIISSVLEDVLDRFFHYKYIKPANVFTQPVQVDSPFVLNGAYITVEKKEQFKNVKNILKYFTLIAKTGFSPSPESKRILKSALSLINRDTLKKSENFELFWSIFTYPYVYEAIKEMHRSGVFFRIFPEFKKIFFKIQYDIYHVYPVDLHSLLVIKELDRLKRGEYVNEQPLLSFLIHEVKDISVLYFSALFHDIGKGYGSGHSKRGAVVVEKIMKRMKIDNEKAKRIIFLILNHLNMSEVAQRRDLSDLKHIFDFTQLVGDRENLKELYLLTFADLKAVSPAALTHWKSALLQELYIKAEEFLEKGKISESVLNEKIVKIQEEVKTKLREKYNKDEIDAFIEIFPVRDFLTNSIEDILQFFEILRILEKEKFYITKYDYPEQKFSKIIFAAVDMPGIFSKITGVLSANGINILSARINTLRNGRILDVFYVNDIVGDAITDGYRWENTIKDLADVMDGRIEITRLVQQRFKPSIIKTKKRRELPPKVVIDNHSSDLYTLVEVYANDRPGLLYTITSALSGLSLNICKAKISTKVDQAADVFYMNDLQGRKILDKKTIKNIRDTLITALKN